MLIAERNASRRSSAPSVLALRRYFLARASGVPIDEVEALRGSASIASYRTLAAFRADLSARRQTLADALFTIIGKASEKRVRHVLVQLRRDLFNGRALRAKDVATARPMLPMELDGALREYSRLLDEETSVLGVLGDAYAADLERSRQQFQLSLLDEDFRRGLLVSSPTLSGNLRRYCEKPVGTFDSRDEQIERGLLRYYTRTAMKATPFGTLCAIMPGCFVDEDFASSRSVARYHGRPRAKRGSVRINKRLFGILWAHLKRRSAVRKTLFVELTPTMTLTATSLHFLTSSDGREVFQRLTRNEALDRVTQVSRDCAGVQLSHLITTLCDDSEIDASVEEAEAFVDQLLALGLLRFRSGVKDQDADWDLPLTRSLANVGDDHARLICELLRDLRARLAEYGDARTDERGTIASEIRARVEAAFASLGIQSKPELPFYEDAAGSAELQILLTDSVTHAVDALRSFVELVMPLSFVRNEQSTMRHFFETYYGPAVEVVPLLRFYEDYYREHLKRHLVLEHAAATKGMRDELRNYDLANPFNLEAITRRLNALRAISDVLRRQWANDPSAVEVRVTRDDIVRTCAEVDPLPARERSVALFCQLDVPPASSDGTMARFVATGPIHVGRGKYFSRFLYVLPDEFRDAVYRDNTANAEELRAEILADGEFNGNLHPSLLAWEISYPTSENSGDAGQLLSSDLEVCRDADTAQELCLIDKRTQKRVVPFDLGFLNPRMRPPLFQLLSRFTQAGAGMFPIPDSPTPITSGRAIPNSPDHDRPAERVESIAYRPRFVFEDRVVIARRRWTVPPSLFPRRDATDSDVAYFVRVNEWREQHGIPEQVYIRIRPLPPRTSSVSTAPRPTAGGESPAARSIEPGTGQVGDDSPLDENHEFVEADVEWSDKARTDSGVAAAIGEHTAPTRLPESKPKPLQKNSRDWQKPQFIDFASPLLVKMFAQIPAALGRFSMSIEERLPSREGLPDAGANRFATELVLQFDFSAANDVPEMIVE